MIVALMTTQRAFAYVILAVVVIGGVFVALSQMRSGKAELGSEIELAPNRKKYLPDEELEGPKLNKALWASFGLLVVIALSLPLYWLAEPGRQQGATDHFRHIFAERGHEMYETGAQCVNCHGPNGTGGAASFVITDEAGAYVDTVDWTAPALDTIFYRFSTDEVMDILTYGRPGTPMPAWGVPGGGPNTTQQLETVIEYLWTVQLSPDEVRKQVDDAVAARDEGLAERMVAVREENEGKDPLGEDFTRLSRADELLLGEILFFLNDAGAGANAFSCARCHVPGASFGRPWTTATESAKGAFGPSLIGIEDRYTESQHYTFVANGNEFGKQSGSVGLGSGKMPGFGVNAMDGNPDDRRNFGAEGMLSPEQVWAIVNYERNLSVERPDLAVAAAALQEGDQ